MDIELFSKQHTDLSKKSHADKIRLFAWYLHVHKGKEQFLPKDIRECYTTLHLDLPSDVSTLLGAMAAKKPPDLLKTSTGYRLERRIRESFDSSTARLAIPAQAIAGLRQQLQRLGNDDAKDFLEEAIKCLEIKQYRAAVVFSWVGAISVLHNHIVNHHLVAFNAEAKRRNALWKDAKNSDDLGLMKEHDFLNVLESISVMGKNVKQQLQNACLSLRNACGHPNSYRIGEAKVIAHLEELMLNVFSRY